MELSLDKFEGPLDLLLQLIEKNKLQITEISLAQMTDQYLVYIEKSDELPSSEVVDFLLIASKLIYLKSKYLLPDFDLEDEDDAASLENQLKIYRQYYEAAKKIDKMYKGKRYTFVRTADHKPTMLDDFWPPESVTKQTLADVFAIILSRIDTVVNLPKVIMAKIVSIGEKISHIRNMIKNAKSLDFSKLLIGKKDKVEIVVNFLAMLELVKQKEVTVMQDKMFGNLNIKRR